MVLKVRTALVLALAAGAALALQGCREDEQDRILLYEPGVYKGEEDPGLSQTQVEELRQRARQQDY